MNTPRAAMTREGVSIHSRRLGREKPGIGGGLSPTESFNPLPPSRTGETREALDKILGFYPSFNPLPPSRTGETPTVPPRSETMLVSIHSRRLGREKRRSCAAPRCICSFNPLPPSRTGETLVAVFALVLSRVSIHSRRLGREKPDQELNAALELVSIHSRRLGREKRFCNSSRPERSSAPILREPPKQIQFFASLHS